MKFLLEAPAISESLKIIQTYARTLAEASGFDSKRAGLIELACEEAFVLVLERADKTKSSQVKFYAEITPLALKVNLDDREIPPLPLLETSPKKSPISLETIDIENISVRLIGEAADEAYWQPLGRQGNRLMMIFNRPQADIRTLEDAKGLQAYSNEVTEENAGPYTIRCAGFDGHTTDWHQIARVMYRTYGFTYFYDDFYIPDRIRELNSSGQVLSIVAVTPSDEVVGHYALDVHGFGDLRHKDCIIGELGKAVVHPGHRGQGLMERMRSYTEEKARSLGLLAIFSQPTTAHPYSQKANERLGAHVCALNIAHVGTHIELKEISNASSSQRVSSFIYFKNLVLPLKRIVYLPLHHLKFLEGTYKACKIPISIQSPSPPLREQSDIEVEYYSCVDFGIIKIKNIGKDIGLKLGLCRDDLVRTSGARVIYLNICLEDPSCETACLHAEKLGFYYSGLAPYHDHGKDVLRMQYVDTNFDLETLSVESVNGKQLLDYIDADRHRVEKMRV